MQFGYEEYLGPLVEDANMYRAKSGEDVGGSELTLLTDREGNITDLSLRPEMTPSVTRMVANRYAQLSKPIRWFSIANFYRNERPQRGRNREFRQLNVDMFGEESAGADLETLQMAVEIMKAFNPPKDAFVIYVNHRVLIDAFLNITERKTEYTDDQKRDIVRLMDKRDKMSVEDFRSACQEKTVLSPDAIEQVVTFMQTDTVDALIGEFPKLGDEQALKELDMLLKQMNKLGYAEYLQFKPGLMRGFDYYDGMVFEVFDKHPDNNRAMFGGGRYNGLAEIFGVKAFPAVGFAPGDEPMRLFLESRHMLDALPLRGDVLYYLPVLDEKLLVPTMQLAAKLRLEGKDVECGTSVKKLGKALEYADKKGVDFVVIFGEDEQRNGQYTVKNLKTGEEEQKALKIS